MYEQFNDSPYVVKNATLAAQWLIRAAELGSALREWDKKIRVVVGDDALKDGGDALEAHACVHARLW